MAQHTDPVHLIHMVPGSITHSASSSTGVNKFEAQASLVPQPIGTYLRYRIELQSGSFLAEWSIASCKVKTKTPQDADAKRSGQELFTEEQKATLMDHPSLYAQGYFQVSAQEQRIKVLLELERTIRPSGRLLRLDVVLTLTIRKCTSVTL